MRRFFDTNVLVYAHDEREQGKRDVSRELVAQAMGDDEFVLSTQVLVEFYATTVRRRLLAPSEARDLLAFWGSHDVVPQTADLVLRAIALHQEHSLSFWDGLIVQAAVDAHCDVLLSEDLQDGRRFGELVIRNPFSGPGLHEPGGRGYVARRSSKIRSSGRATAGRSTSSTPPQWGVRVLDVDGMLMSKETDRPEDIPDRQRLLRLKGPARRRG